MKTKKYGLKAVFHNCEGHKDYLTLCRSLYIFHPIQHETIIKQAGAERLVYSEQHSGGGAHGPTDWQCSFSSFFEFFPDVFYFS